MLSYGPKHTSYLILLQVDNLLLIFSNGILVEEEHKGR
jgi:hypothetical protein